jgi:hypothetical protein
MLHDFGPLLFIAIGMLLFQAELLTVLLTVHFTT